MLCSVCFKLRDKLIREFPDDNLRMVDGCSRYNIESVDRHGNRKSHIILGTNHKHVLVAVTAIATSEVLL